MSRSSAQSATLECMRPRQSRRGLGCHLDSARQCPCLCAKACKNRDVALPLEVRIAEGTHAVGIWGTTLIQVWRGQASGSAAAAMVRVGTELVASSQRPTTSLFVVEPSSPPPGDEMRRQLAVFSRDVVSRMALAVVVAEGNGFRGAIVRAVGVALTTLLPHSSRFEFVDDVESAARLLAPHLALESGGPQRLSGAVEELRARIGAGTTRVSARTRE